MRTAWKRGGLGLVLVSAACLAEAQPARADQDADRELDAAVAAPAPRDADDAGDEAAYAAPARTNLRRSELDESTESHGGCSAAPSRQHAPALAALFSLAAAWLARRRATAAPG
jgi:uncharacterized protein (TIGR03382 family)